MILGKHIVDWLSALSGLGGTIIAALVAWQGYKEFLQTPRQKSEPDEASLANEPVDDQEMSEEVFQTSKQTTRLRVTDRGLECHLDDQREGRGGHQWTISPRQAKGILEVGNFSVNPGYRSQTGRFNVGSRRNWLYSKALFPEPDILRGTLKVLLEAAAQKTPA
jgi:hypothetical protein